MTIPLKSTVAPPLQASQWLKLAVLLDTSEMCSLLDALQPFWMVQVGRLIPQAEAIISPEKFLEAYAQYVTALQQGKICFSSQLRAYFSTVWTTWLEALYQVQKDNGLCLARVRHPVIQLQTHQFDYAASDGKFRSMALGQNSILWGLQFSYPRLYQNEEAQVFRVNTDPQFPNTLLFKRLQRWVRHHTLPTPLEVQGAVTHLPMRLGRDCFSWINAHPQLAFKGLRVANRSDLLK